MKKVSWLLLLAGVMLIGCGQEQAPPPEVIVTELPPEVITIYVDREVPAPTPSTEPEFCGRRYHHGGGHHQ